MDIESLYPLVTTAIRRAEILSDLGKPNAANAYAKVSRIEEQITNLLPASEEEGAISRRGAVRAAIAAKDFSRVIKLVARFVAEPDTGPELKNELLRLEETVAAKPVSRRKLMLHRSGPTPGRFAAIDTRILLALGNGDGESQKAIDRLSSEGFYFVVTETPLQELADICQNAVDDRVKSAARFALEQTTNFGFLTPSLSPVQIGVAERVAQRLIAGHHSSGELELNDGLVIAEAAYNNCRLLVTNRKMLHVIEMNWLRLALVDSDLSAVMLVAPNELMTNLSRPRERR